MLKIGDFSQLAQVTVRTLRHYDAVGLLKPAHIDPFSEYRYYTLEQLPVLNRILALKDLGLSLDEVKQLLADAIDQAALRELLAQKRAELAQEVAQRQAQLQRVANRLELLEQNPQAPGPDVVLRPAPALRLAAVSCVVPDLASMHGYRWAASNHLYATLATAGIKAGTPEVVLYHVAEYMETMIPLDFTTPIGANVELPPGSGVTLRELPAAPLVASVIHTGPIHKVANTISALMHWIGLHDYATTGPARELHLIGCEYDDQSYTSPEGFVMEVAFPIVPASAEAAE